MCTLFAISSFLSLARKSPKGWSLTPSTALGLLMHSSGTTLATAVVRFQARFSLFHSPANIYHHYRGPRANDEWSYCAVSSSTRNQHRPTSWDKKQFIKNTVLEKTDAAVMQSFASVLCSSVAIEGPINCVLIKCLRHNHNRL